MDDMGAAITRSESAPRAACASLLCAAEGCGWKADRDIGRGVGVELAGGCEANGANHSAQREDGRDGGAELARVKAHRLQDGYQGRAVGGGGGQ